MKTYILIGADQNYGIINQQDHQLSHSVVTWNFTLLSRTPPIEVEENTSAMVLAKQTNQGSSEKNKKFRQKFLQ